MIKIWLHILPAVCIALGFMACSEGDNKSPTSLRQSGIAVAFMPDVHFHDVFGEFENDAFKGLPTGVNGQVSYAKIRTMEAQLNSTRLFNENYFAFLAALDNAVERGIKYIALPGDFSDDGQMIHMRGLVNILNEYSDKYGLEFFATPGNHDPNRPFTQEAGKRDYLGEGGRPQPIYSTGHNACINSGDYSKVQPGDARPHDVICADEVKEAGYEKLMNVLGDHGYYPQKHHVYYETPYSTYDRSDYSFDLAVQEAGYLNRQYEICHEGTGGPYRKPTYTNCLSVADMSYLVEPVEGLWLLAIDANVYQPRENTNESDPANPDNFSGSGNAGYNKMLSHKQHVITWIGDVVRRAEKEGKTLVAFSHFPMLDFYDGAQDKIEGVWGEGTFQLARMPQATTSRVLAETGLKIHIGGHMHMNDTGVFHDEESGHTLFNIQAPSLAAYIPAFKVVYMNGSTAEVETIVLEEVPGFDLMFPHYQEEWNYLDQIGYDKIWNREVLNSTTYYEFADWHIKELSRLRFLPEEWPEDMRIMLNSMTGREMLVASKMDSTFTPDDYNQLADLYKSGFTSMDISRAWKSAELEAQNQAENAGVKLSDLAQWTGSDLSVDFYRLRNADELALRDISDERIEQYSLVLEAFSDAAVVLQSGENLNNNSKIELTDMFKVRFKEVLEVMHLFSNGDPSDHFRIDFQTGQLISLSEEKKRIIRK